jgi:hypothetical protein
MTAIEPENGSSAFQPQEGFDFPALVTELVDTAAGVIRALDAAREAREAKEEACAVLGDLLGYIDLTAPGTDPEVSGRIVKALSVLEGIAA